MRAPTPPPARGGRAALIQPFDETMKLDAANRRTRGGRAAIEPERPSSLGPEADPSSARVPVVPAAHASAYAVAPVVRVYVPGVKFTAATEIVYGSAWRMGVVPLVTANATYEPLLLRSEAVSTPPIMAVLNEPVCCSSALSWAMRVSKSESPP